MTLIYSYITTIGDQTNFKSNMLGFSASMIRSKQLGYQIKLYGCQTTLDYLNGYYDIGVLVDSNQFVFTDDLKIYIHKNEDLNCITIDGDIILYERLNIPNDCDIIFDRRGKIKNKDFNSKYYKIFNILRNFNIEDDIKYFDFKGVDAFNVGILKFNNSEIKSNMLSSYDTIREYFYKNIYPIIGDEMDLSVMFCEYYFSRIIKINNISTKYFSESSSYEHYFYNKKFSKKYKNDIEKILKNGNVI